MVGQLWWGVVGGMLNRSTVHVFGQQGWFSGGGGGWLEEDVVGAGGRQADGCYGLGLHQASLSDMSCGCMIRHPVWWVV